MRCSRLQDDTEFKNPFDSTYIRVKRPRDQGGSRSRSRSRSRSGGGRGAARRSRRCTLSPRSLSPLPTLPVPCLAHQVRAR